MAGTQSILFDVRGEHPTYPELRVQPTSQRSSPTAAVGWKYRRRYTIANTASKPLLNYPYALNVGATDGLVSGSKMLSSGDDLRVWINGLEVARTLNTVNSATDCYVWIVIPYLAAGGSMLVEVVYGNASAGSPPTLTAGTDLPAFDIAATGGGRSTNSNWVYLVDRTAANAGKGGWYLSSGTAQPEINQAVPGAWEDVGTGPVADDSWQLPYATYTDSGVKYQGRFEARRGRTGSLLPGEGFGADGVALTNPVGITSVTADMRWINMAMGDTDTTPVGALVILTRASEAEQWVKLYENATLQTTEATITSATYTPPAAVAELAFAVWPNNGSLIERTARVDRYINAAWWSTLSVAINGSAITQTVTEAETEIYELATELRYGGGGAATTVAPSRSILLGNARSATGAGSPHLACKINEQIVVRSEARKAEVWDSSLAAKVEDAPLAAVSAVESVVRSDGTAVEQPSADWMPWTPMADPLTNSSADTVATGWVKGATTVNLTADATPTRDTSSYDTAPASLTANVTANTSGTGGTVEYIASDYLPVGNRQNVEVGAALRTDNTNLQPTPTVWFYDSSNTLIGSRDTQADWTIGATNTWYRRLFAASVPAGAVTYRVGVVIKSKTSNQTGQVWWDTVAVNDTEIALFDVAIGAITLSARWQDRYAYA